VTHFKYRIQVGDEYYYRSNGYALDLLVSSLLEGVDHGHTLAAERRRPMPEARRCRSSLRGLRCGPRTFRSAWWWWSRRSGHREE
jgi:hypothetical protein